MSKIVEANDKIKVNYEGRLEDGEVFDSSIQTGHSLEFEAGSGKLIKGFDEAVIGMKEGEEKEITITPDKAYGEYNDKLMHKVSKEQLPKDQEPKEGMKLIMKSPNGQQIPAVIKELTDKEVVIDMNHPLAGKTLAFKLKVEEIIKKEDLPKEPENKTEDEHTCCSSKEGTEEGKKEEKSEPACGCKEN